MTLQDWFTHTLPQHPDPELAALELRYLIEFCTGVSPTKQRIINLELSKEQISTLNELAQRLFQGEPLSYLVGYQPFWDLNLKVTAATLIPRADTEVIIERALEHAKKMKSPMIYDLGTGSGAIAIVLARELPTATIIASDFSLSALKIAKENAQQYDLQNLSFVHGHWLEPFSSQSADLIVSNPPYIASDDPHLQALRYEPQSALIAANSGYQDLFSIILQTPRVLKKEGWLLLEHGYQQGSAIQKFAEETLFFQHIKTLPDRAGRERFTEMQLFSD